MLITCDSRGGVVQLELEVVAAMRRLATGRTDETLNERFGISYNAWRKLLAGEPIRASVAARLMARIEALATGETAR